MKLKYSLILVITILPLLVVSNADALLHEVVPYEKDYLPYTENYNVPFDYEGKIDYDLLIMKIMPEIFEEKLLAQGVNIARQDIVLNRGPQISMYQESSSVCGYVIDYTDDQVYWLSGGINSTHIRNTEISTETPTYGGEEYNTHGCFTPLKEKVALIFLEDKSYLTEKEESIVAAAVKHELKGNPNIPSQEFTVGKFNYDYGSDTLSFCGQFQNSKSSLKYFGGTLKNSILKDFHAEKSLSPLCAISDNAEIHSIKNNQKSDVPPEFQVWKNIRMETVFVKDSSVEKLLERNYMRVVPVKNMIFEYATSIEIELIEFRPDESGTLFLFDPTTQDTFAKIRVPQNGGNYYMSYGPNEWNVGDITGVIISVEEDDLEYKQQPFINAPNAPYPQYFTDYIFKVPKGSTMMAIVLDIENYEPDPDHSKDEWIPWVPDKSR